MSDINNRTVEHSVRHVLALEIMFVADIDFTDLSDLRHRLPWSHDEIASKFTRPMFV